MLLKNKTAVITGCNRGIGRSVLELFAANGADIFACVRRESEEFSASAANLAKTHAVNIIPVYFDLTDEDEMKAGLKKIAAEKRRIDILVNNAGAAHGGLLSMTTVNTVRQIFECNYFSQILMMQYISRLMIKQKSGSIVNMASVAGIDGAPGNCAYGASKAALILVTKSVSKELAPYNIRVNAVAPGLCATDMADLMENKARENMISSSAMNRLGSPREIANVVLFLASDQASFITGQIYRVDGGM